MPQCNPDTGHGVASAVQVTQVKACSPWKSVASEKTSQQVLGIVRQCWDNVSGLSWTESLGLILILEKGVSAISMKTES